MVAASIVPGSDVTIRNVLMNPTRTGLLTALRLMGASIDEVDGREIGGERVADLRVRHASLSAIEVPADLAPSMIDEYPILFVAAAFAKGTTIARGAHELRVKESDRIAAMAAALGLAGVRLTEHDDGLSIEGRDGEPLPGTGSDRVASLLDHRIAMSMAVAGMHSSRPVRIDDAAPIATSYPLFVDTATRLGAAPQWLNA
jgi:3-phosphoshikimate 1-carboxyvinyltransferase